MTMPGRNITVAASLTSAAATTVEGETADITPYSAGNTPYRASGTAVVAPGTAEAGSALVKITVGGTTAFVYDLEEDVDWQAGKEYVYSMRLTDEGLVPYTSYVTGWGESENELTGDAEEVTGGAGD